MDGAVGSRRRRRMLMFMGSQPMMVLRMIVIGVRVRVERGNVAPSREKGEPKHDRNHALHCRKCMEGRCNGSNDGLGELCYKG